MSWENVQQIVRIVLYWASGHLVTSGQLDPTNAETLVGGILAIISVIWWWVWNRQQKKPADG
jgi:hypothetical protein